VLRLGAWTTGRQPSSELVYPLVIVRSGHKRRCAAKELSGPLPDFSAFFDASKMRLRLPVVEEEQ
jgi:hypothetical protein